MKCTSFQTRGRGQTRPGGKRCRHDQRPPLTLASVSPAAYRSKTSQAAAKQPTPAPTLKRSCVPRSAPSKPVLRISLNRNEVEAISRPSLSHSHGAPRNPSQEKTVGKDQSITSVPPTNAKAFPVRRETTEASSARLQRKNV